MALSALVPATSRIIFEQPVRVAVLGRTAGTEIRLNERASTPGWHLNPNTGDLRHNGINASYSPTVCNLTERDPNTGETRTSTLLFEGATTQAIVGSYEGRATSTSAAPVVVVPTNYVGPIQTLVPALGKSSTFTLLTASQATDRKLSAGTNSNLTLSGANIIVGAPIASGTTQYAAVEEADTASGVSRAFLLAFVGA